MEQEGFAPEFTQFKMQVKQVGLETDQAYSVCNVEVRVVRILPQRVKAAFANGFDLRLGYKGAEEAQVGRGNASGVPGVDADRIAVAGAQKRYGLKIQLTRKRAAGSPMIYGIKIDKGVAAQDVGVDIEIHSLSGYRIIA